METVQLEIPGLHDPAADARSAEIRRGLTVATNRQALLEALFFADGRDSPDHPQAHTYTGLAEAFHQELGREVAEYWLEEPGFRPRLGGSVQVTVSNAGIPTGPSARQADA